MTERIDDLQCNGYRIIQDEDDFCFGVDAVLLANFAAGYVRQGMRVLDLGTGTGVIPILLAAKTMASGIYGLEIRKEAVELGRRSVMLNGLEDRVYIMEGDIRNIQELSFFKAINRREASGASSMDVVTCNPPYIKIDAGLPSEGKGKMISKHEIYVKFKDIVDASAFSLKTGGHFFLVHRPERLAEIMIELVRRKLEPKSIRMVHPREDLPARLFLLHAVKGGRSGMSVEAPDILNNMI